MKDVKALPDLFYAFRISQFVDDVMAEEEIFRERLDREGVILELTAQMELLPFEEFWALKEQAFKQRVGQFMAAQLLPGLWGTGEPDGEEGN
jgi:hypothetical protein